MQATSTLRCSSMHSTASSAGAVRMCVRRGALWCSCSAWRRPRSSIGERGHDRAAPALEDIVLAAHRRAGERDAHHALGRGRAVAGHTVVGLEHGDRRADTPGSLRRLGGRHGGHLEPGCEASADDHGRERARDGLASRTLASPTDPLVDGASRRGHRHRLGKMLFGGLGWNLFNPALVGRGIVIISWAGVLAESSVPGGWFQALDVPAVEGYDAISGATRLAIAAADRGSRRRLRDRPLLVLPAAPLPEPRGIAR